MPNTARTPQKTRGAGLATSAATPVPPPGVASDDELDRPPVATASGRPDRTGLPPAESRTHGTEHPHTEPGYIHQKDAQLKRLRRIEGQVRGLHRMVESDTYCIDILTQVSAATKALEAVALGLLQDHLKHCLVDAAQNPSVDLNDKLDEASAAIARLVRS